MTTLIFVRHGESEANRRDIFAGHLDIDLEENGLKQAEKTALYIKENYCISKVYASDLKRAFRTGKCIADLCGVEIVKNENLREISAGEWEGVSFSKLHEEYNREFGIWCDDIGNSACNGGESVKELAERILVQVEKIARENDGKEVVIATHATPVRVMQCIASGMPISDMKKIPWTSNASVTEIEFDEHGKFNLIKASIDGHLKELKTLLPDNV